MKPDERSIGGRYTLEMELRNMHKKILNASSNLDTHLDREKVAGRPRPTSAKVYRETRETTKREADTLRRISQRTRSSRKSFSGPPETLHLASKLSENRRRRQNVTDRSSHEHERNMYHLNRRIQSRCSLTERKKNRFDAEVNPVFLRRKELPPPVTLSSISSTHLLSQKKKQTLLPAASQTKKNVPDGRNTRTAEGSRSRSALVTANRTQKKGAASHGAVYSEPMSSVATVATSSQLNASKNGLNQEEKMYHLFRQKLLDEILQKQLYDEDALHDLFLGALENNKHIQSLHVLRNVIVDLCDYLNVDIEM